jgi:hypothetical protein
VAAIAEFPHAIFRKSIDVALLAPQIELAPVGRESDCLLTKEPLDLGKHIKHFTSYKFTILYRLSKEDFAIFGTLLAPRLRRTHILRHGCAAAVGPTHDHTAARQQSTLGS